jgi:hypothetical protein
VISLEQARREFELICDIDILFLADEDAADSSDLIGFFIRQCRKEELLEQISHKPSCG